GSPGHHRHPVGSGPAQHGLHLFSAPRPDHGQRFAGRRVESAVLAVTLSHGGVGDHHPVGQAGDQAGQHIDVHEALTGRSYGAGSTANSGAWSSSRSDGSLVAIRPINTIGTANARNVTFSPAASASGPATSKPSGPAA